MPPTPTIRLTAGIVRVAGWLAILAAPAAGLLLAALMPAARAQDAFSYAGIALTAGHRFADGLRIEGELALRSAEMRDIDAALAKADAGHTHLDTAFVARLCEPAVTGWLQPQAGLGIGVARIRHDLVRSAAGGSVHDEDTVGAAQLVFGARMPVGPGWDAFADLRLIATETGRYTAGDDGPPEGAVRVQTFGLGLLRRFWPARRRGPGQGAGIPACTPPGRTLEAQRSAAPRPGRRGGFREITPREWRHAGYRDPERRPQARVPDHRHRGRT
jgi:hypothetical protein